MSTGPDRLRRLQIAITRGHPVKIKNQVFTGHTRAIKTIHEVNETYKKMRSLYSDCRHIICAFHLPGRNFHNLQDFCDDDEHGAGAFLLRKLEDSEIMNRVVFVTRNYNGDHIGDKRFSAMFDAVKSTLEAAPPNEVTGVQDYLWSSEESGNPTGAAAVTADFAYIPARGGLLPQFAKLSGSKSANGAHLRVDGETLNTEEVNKAWSEIGEGQTLEAWDDVPRDAEPTRTNVMILALQDSLTLKLNKIRNRC